MRLPNLVIAGAQKSGTTWLHTMLDMHPHIKMSRPKELGFFNRPYNIDDRLALDHYMSHFSDAGEHRYVGESTPHYFWVKSPECPFSPKGSDHDIAKFMRETLGPLAKIIILLRDPVTRAVSAFHHHFAMGRIDCGSSILSCDHSLGIVDMGFYKRHLRHWSDVFRGELQVYVYDDIKSKPTDLLRSVLQSLELSDAELPPRELIDRRVNARTAILRRFREAGSEFPGIRSSDVPALLDLYLPSIEYVESYLQRDLPTWKDIDYLMAGNCGSMKAV